MTTFSFGLLKFEHNKLQFVTECRLSDTESLFICEFSNHTSKHHFEEFKRNMVDSIQKQMKKVYVMIMRQSDKLPDMMQKHKEHAPEMYNDTSKRCIKIVRDVETGFSAVFVDYKKIDPENDFHIFVE